MKINVDDNIVYKAVFQSALGKEAKKVEPVIKVLSKRMIELHESDKQEFVEKIDKSVDRKIQEESLKYWEKLRACLKTKTPKTEVIDDESDCLETFAYCALSGTLYANSRKMAEHAISFLIAYGKYIDALTKEEWLNKILKKYYKKANTTKNEYDRLFVAWGFEKPDREVDKTE